MPIKRSELGLSEEQLALRNINLEVLGARLRRVRTEKKLSQRHLTAGLFTSAYLSSLELGKTRPALETLTALCERLDKSVEYFLRPSTGGLTSELSAEQLSVLEVRLALLTAQTVLEKGADVRAEKALETVGLHLARLTQAEKARYHYLCGKYKNLVNEQEQALTTLEEATGYLEEASDPEQAALIEYELGQALSGQRRLMLALTHYQTGLTQLDQIPTPASPTLRYKLLLAVANCYLALGDGEQAKQVFGEALSSAQITTSLETQAEGFYQHALTYGEQGDFERASLALGRTAQIYVQAQEQALLLATHNALAEIQLHEGQWEEAELQAKAALKLAGLNGPQAHTGPQIKALVTLALICQSQNKLALASSYIEEALKLREGCSKAGQLARLYQTAAEIAALLGQREEAEGYYRQAFQVLQGAAQTEQEPQLSALYHSYGQRLREWGQVEKAFEYLDKAYRQRERSGQLEAKAAIVS
jgi:tetratricopeptide (TPR) repeat protein